MKKYLTKEVSIALITIISGFILFAGLNYMKGTNIFQHTNYYLIKMQNVSELQKSSPVYADGFKVGTVHGIDFGYENHSKITVHINLDKKMKVPQGSYFVLKSGLTSGAYLDLMLNKHVSEYATPGDTLEGRAESGLMEKISDNVLPYLAVIMPRLDSIMTGIQTLVTHPALAQSLDNIRSTTETLEQSSKHLNMILTDVSPIITNLNKVSSDFTAVSENLSKINFSQTMETVDNALNNIDLIIAQLNKQDNSIGLLLNNRSLYNNLDSVALNMSKLLIDVQQNPKKYVKLSLF
ncbi:MAG: MlaD family protein [Dysgonamonadaceae bacterium]|jgi:phospholipid/cholesterol/gamma-HCH transport system substrate-binding protein|nr:MlaD family protein [Dysgonamonadaceae bacterium]